MEYVNSTSSNNDDASIQYILDCRCTDQIEYLVRYNDPKYKYDIWVKSSDLTCYNKLLDFYDGKVPDDIVKNVKSENCADIFRIYKIETVNNEIMLDVHIPGNEGIVTKNVNDIKNDYIDEITEYYEKHLIEND